MSQIVEKTLASIPKLLTQSIRGNGSGEGEKLHTFSMEVQTFMKNVHRTHSKAQESSLVRTEMSVVEQKLKQADLTSSPALVRSSFTKAIFCLMLGYDVDFLTIHAVILAQQGKNFSKRLGYLSACLLLHPKHEMSMLMTATLLRDLKSSNISHKCVALTAVGQLANAENIPSILPDVVARLGDSQDLIKEKALHCICALYRNNPNLIIHAVSKCTSHLGSRDPGVLNAAVNLFFLVIQENPSQYVELGHSFLHILQQINTRAFGSNYYYRMIPLPWLQIRLIKIISILCPLDFTLCSKSIPLLKSLIERTRVSEPISLALLVECVSAVTKLPASEELLHLCSRCISKLLTGEASVEMRYQGLGLLISLAKLKPKLAAAHQLEVVECLGSDELSIQIRTAHLLHVMANSTNVKAICAKLFEQANKSTDKAFSNEILLIISSLVEQLSFSIEWYFQIYLQIFKFTLRDDLDSKFRQLVLSYVYNFVGSLNISLPGNLIVDIVEEIASFPSLPLLRLSLDVLLVFSGCDTDFSDYQKLLGALESLFIYERKKEKPLLSPLESSLCSSSALGDKDRIIAIEIMEKLILKEKVDPEEIVNWISRINMRVLSGVVLFRIQQLEELVHSQGIKERATLVFNVTETDLDLSLSFLDKLVVNDILNSRRMYKPEYLKLLNVQNNSDSELFQTQSLTGDESMSLSIISSGENIHKKDAKWKEFDDSASMSSAERFSVVNDSHTNTDKLKKEQLAKELFAGFEIDSDDKESEQKLRFGKSMWDDDSVDTFTGNRQSFSLNPFGISPIRKPKSKWHDVLNDNVLSSNNNQDFSRDIKSTIPSVIDTGATSMYYSMANELDAGGKKQLHLSSSTIDNLTDSDPEESS